MERRLGVTEARKEFRTIVDHVEHQGDTYIINRHGKPAAAVVPMKLYERWQKERREFFAILRKSAQEADLDPDEAMRIALEAQQAARAETRKNR